MYISKFEIKNIRGVGLDGLMVDLAKAAKLRPMAGRRSPMAGWNVIAGPNGYGKTTLLQCIAASLMGTSGGRLLIGPDDNQWLAHGATIGTTTSWIERTPEDDHTSADDETLKPVRLRVDWLRGGGVRYFFPKGNHNFVYTQFWDAFDIHAKPNGWVFAGYGPHRAIQRSSNDAYKMIDKTKPRASAVVGLFRDDAALEKGHEWLKGLAAGRGRGDAVKASVLAGIIRILCDKLFNSEQSSALLMAEEEGLKLRMSSGVALPVLSLGDGTRMLINMIVDILYQIEQFKPGRLYEDMIQWQDNAMPTIKMSGVVVIDEPENHLHPALQQRLGFWLKGHFPNIQFIVCTHSALICQAADMGGLFRMSGPFRVEPVEMGTWEAITNGTLDDAIMTELFGLGSPIAPEGQKLRKELGDLESEMQRRPATSEMI